VSTSRLPSRLLAALLCCACVQLAYAQGTERTGLALFGTGGSANTAYVYSGLILPFSGNLGDNGLRLRLWAAGTRFEYEADEPLAEVDAWGPDLEAAVGYHWDFGHSSLNLYTGVKYRALDLDPEDPDTELENENVGPTSHVEIWHSLTEDFGFSLLSSYTAFISDYWVRLRPYGILSEHSLGPEFVFSGGEQYDHQRLGAFIDGFQLGFATLGFSAGAERERGGDVSPYGTLSVSFVF
jgi:hypothetical protein